MELVSNIYKKKRGGGGMRNWKKLKLIAMSIQRWETTQGDNETAKYVCLQFHNSGVYTYLKNIGATRRE